MSRPGSPAVMRPRDRLLAFVMALGIYKLAFLLRIGSPKQKHQTLALCSQPTDKHVRELLPALSLVRSRLSLLNGEHAVKQQYALLGPRGKITTICL